MDRASLAVTISWRVVGSDPSITCHFSPSSKLCDPYCSIYRSCLSFNQLISVILIGQFFRHVTFARINGYTPTVYRYVCFYFYSTCRGMINIYPGSDKWIQFVNWTLFLIIFIYYWKYQKTRSRIFVRNLLKNFNYQSFELVRTLIG